MNEPPIPLFALKFNAPPSPEESITGKLNDVEINQEIGLICTGKISNPRRGVSIAKAQCKVLYGCSRVVNVSLKS
uniref:Retrotransposon, putative, centromere-specific n=3 Tax=Oryza sativa TaxID=4530 RepID=Q8W2V1_ORYSJ|nr:hypothetical protein [Oryza sativa Japonica Group]AAL79346.1 Unknown protein [Oryza sativa]AAP53274.1 retrotransposon, putative, centromere-specific [Oryza sativa Japonica Group]